MDENEDDEESIVELLEDLNNADSADADKPNLSPSHQSNNSTPIRKSPSFSSVSDVDSSTASSRSALQQRQSAISTQLPRNTASGRSKMSEPFNDENVDHPSMSPNRKSWQSIKQTSVRSRVSSNASLASMDKRSEPSFVNGRKHNNAVTSTEVSQRSTGNKSSKTNGAAAVKLSAPSNPTEKTKTGASEVKTDTSAGPKRTANVKPVIMDRSLPRLAPPPRRAPPSLDHIRKANSRLNMSFENQKFYEIVKDNLYLADRIQSAKSSYAKDSSEPPKVVIRSKLEVRQSKELYNLAQENLVSPHQSLRGK